MHIYELPDDLIIEIFSYLVELCGYKKNKLRITLKRAFPEIYHLFNKGIESFNLETQKHLLVQNIPHEHYIDPYLGMNLCSYTCPLYVINIYSKLNDKLDDLKSTFITIHFKERISKKNKKKIPYIVNDFLKRRGAHQYVFSHICCGGFGIYCKRFKSKHHRLR